MYLHPSGKKGKHVKFYNKKYAGARSFLVALNIN